MWLLQDVVNAFLDMALYYLLCTIRVSRKRPFKEKLVVIDNCIAPKTSG